MSPDTVHLFAQLIRHQRGALTACEKWVKSPTFSRDEALNAIYTIRRIVDSYEKQLSAVVTNGQ